MEYYTRCWLTLCGGGLPQVFRSSDKSVAIKVNGVPIDLEMKVRGSWSEARCECLPTRGADMPPCASWVTLGRDTSLYRATPLLTSTTVWSPVTKL